VVISVLFDHGIANEEALFRPRHLKGSKWAESHTLRISGAEVALKGLLFLRIEYRPGGPEILSAGLDAFLTTDASFFIYDTGVGSFRTIYLKGPDWASLQTWGVSALKAHLGLVVTLEILLFDEDPRVRG
jgi:hypothetical protein